MAGAVLGHRIVEGAINGVRAIKARAETLRAGTTLPFNVFHNSATSIRESDIGQIKPLTDWPQAATNTVINRFIVAGWPADSWTALGAIRTACTPFYAAARTLADSVEDPVTFDGQGNTVYADVDVTSLHASLDTILAACAVLE